MPCSRTCREPTAIVSPSIARATPTSWSSARARRPFRGRLIRQGRGQQRGRADGGLEEYRSPEAEIRSIVHRAKHIEPLPAPIELRIRREQ
jgi:hypothetical protein